MRNASCFCNPDTAPATVGEWARSDTPLSGLDGKASLAHDHARESGDRPEGDRMPDVLGRTGGAQESILRYG